MFFHTKRELELTKAFGITDRFGLKLINSNHSFPYLVEQEERFHGALISNTTFGGMYRLFESLDYNENLSNLDVAFELPHAPRDYTKQTFQICRAIRRRILDESLQVHEAFAKYSAFKAQIYHLKECSQELHDLLNEESSKYPFLQRLVDIFGVPTAQDDGLERITYTIGKWILNTRELDLLYSKSDLYVLNEWLKGDYLNYTSQIMARADAALTLAADQLPTLVSILKDSEHEELTSRERAIFGKAQLKTIFNFFGTKLSTLGFEQCPLQSTNEIYTKSIAISVRIQLLSEHIHTFLKTDHVEMMIKGTEVWDNAVLTNVTLPSILSSDLALRVCYDQVYNEHSRWTFISKPDEIKPDFEHHILDRLLIYPGITDQGELSCMLNASIGIGSNNHNKHIVVKNYVYHSADMKELLAFVGDIQATEKIFFFLPINTSLDDYLQTARKLSCFGRLSIWVHNADLFNLFLPVGRHFLLFTEKYYDQAQKTLNMPVDVPLMHVSVEEEYCMFSAAPNYFVDVLYRFTGHNPGNEYMTIIDKLICIIPGSDRFVRFTDRTEVVFSIKERASLMAALAAFQVVYEQKVFPTYLPVYNTSKMLKHINTIL